MLLSNLSFYLVSITSRKYTSNGMVDLKKTFILCKFRAGGERTLRDLIMHRLKTCSFKPNSGSGGLRPGQGWRKGGEIK